MKRVVTSLLVLGLLAAEVTTASAEESSLPGGTAISVDITSPNPGEGDFAFFEENTDVVVQGTASVGEGLASPDTTIIYLIDVSGSMDGVVGFDCDPAVGNDTRLDCAKVAAKTVNTAAAASGTVQNAAVIGFNSGAPAGGSTIALTDLTTESGAAVVNGRIDHLDAGGGTNFQAALNAARAALTSGSAAPNKLIVVISDGVNGGAVSDPGFPAGTDIEAFAIGGNGCGSGVGSLQSVANLTGGNCTVVTDVNLPGLGGIINQAIGSALSSITVAVCDDDGADIICPDAQIHTTTTPAIDETGLPGPASVGFTATVPAGDLSLGTNTICASALGSDSGGIGSVRECVRVDVVQATVDCSTSSVCQVQANDGTTSSATVSGLDGFDKSLGVTPAPGLSCAQNTVSCTTAYNVQFPDLGQTGGVVKVVVVTSREDSVRLRDAKVFLEDANGEQEVARSCRIFGADVLPCRNIVRLFGRNIYLVKFDGDPFVKFR